MKIMPSNLIRVRESSENPFLRFLSEKKIEANYPTAFSAGTPKKGAVPKYYFNLFAES